MQLVLLFCVFGTSQALLVKLGLQDDPNRPRTWFPEDPECHPKTCPEPDSEKWIELNQKCCQNTNTALHCQKAEDGVTMSFCMQPIDCPAGTFADLLVIREKRWTGLEDFCLKCPSLDFQPHPTQSLAFLTPNCQHRRKLCHSLQAVDVRPGNASEDDVCRCPNYRGFRPIQASVNNNDCTLFYSSSGCSCEHVRCPKKLKLTTKGYVCLDKRLATTLDDIDLNDFASINQVPLVEKITFKICIGEDCPQPWPCWVCHLLERVRVFHRDFGYLFSVLLFSVLAYGLSRVWIWIIEGQKQAIFVCIVIPSAKACELVYEELKNIKPLLERMYGPLILDHHEDFAYITIIVRPDTAEKKFRLLEFVKDLLSTVSINKHLNGSRKDVKVLVKSGTSSEVRKAWFQEATFKQRSADSALDLNTGEVILRFAKGEQVETTILRELAASRNTVRTIFHSFGLKFSEVRRGSIKLRFHLPHDTDVFNSLTDKDLVRQLATDLLSHEAFKQLNKREDLQLEFICKTRVSQVVVIQAEQLAIQVGNNNHIHIGNFCPQPVDGAQQDEEDFLEFPVDLAHDPMVPLGAEFSTFNVVGIPARRQAINAAPDEVALDPSSKAIPVTFKCDAATAGALYDEWTNVLPLLRKDWPDCKLHKRGDKVWWELSRKTNRQPNVSLFIGDIFLPERLKALKEKHGIVAEVSVNRFNFDAVDQAMARLENIHRHVQCRDTARDFFYHYVTSGIPATFLMYFLFALCFSGILNNFGMACVTTIACGITIPFIIILYPKMFRMMWAEWNIIPEEVKSIIMWVLIIWKIVTLLL